MKYVPGTNKKLEQREIAYAIGIQHRPNSFGMINGPSKTEQEMLDCFGVDNSFIIRFNPDWTDDCIWKWEADRWASI